MIAVPHHRYPFNSWRRRRFFDETSLERINRGDPEEQPNTIVVGHFQDRWMVSRRSA